MIYDQDKQILERNTYNYATSTIAFSEPTFNYTSSGGMTKDDVMSFYLTNSYGNCQFVGLTFTWDFGDGTAPIVTTSTAVQTHKYANAGTYNITLTVSAAGYTSKSTTISIVLTAPLLTVPIYVSNSVNSAEIISISFSQGGTVKYKFTANQFSGNIKIPAGEYYITVITSGTFGCIKFDSYSTINCINFFRTSYSTTASLSNSLSVFLKSTNCDGN